MTRLDDLQKGKRLKTAKQLEICLKVEYAACRADKTLLKNDYVQGYVNGLEFALGLVEN
jgi:hypothetical protein